VSRKFLSYQTVVASHGEHINMETVTNGYVVENGSVVAELMLTFDTLRSEALPRGASREMILKGAEQWT